MIPHKLKMKCLDDEIKLIPTREELADKINELIDYIKETN